jgi:hypothetical protein
VTLLLQQTPKGLGGQEIAAMLPLALKNAVHTRMHEVEDEGEVRNL